MSEENTPPEGGDEAFDFGGEDVAALKAEIQALKDQVLRYAAEAENTKRRFQILTQIKKAAGQKSLASPTGDNFRHRQDGNKKADAGRKHGER